jgi:FAD/FMN-containing dehydrogenase
VAQDQMRLRIIRLDRLAGALQVPSTMSRPAPYGEIVTCSDERNSDLFNAMLGGLGQCGIIAKVVMHPFRTPAE